jgi:hypothetical protein
MWGGIVPPPPKLCKRFAPGIDRSVKTSISMAKRPEIFRPEALAQRERADAAGSVVKLGPRWTTWAFWALIGLVLVGFVGATQIHIDRYARGATAIDERGRVVVLVPAALAPDVAPGRPVDLGAARAEVASSRTAVLYPPDIKERYGIDVAIPSVAVVTTAHGGDDTPGTARVLVESEPVIVALVPGLKALFGDDGA